MLCLPAARATASIQMDDSAAAVAREEATEEDMVDTDIKEDGPGATGAAGAPAVAVADVVAVTEGINEIALADGRHTTVVEVFTGQNRTRHIYQVPTEANRQCIQQILVQGVIDRIKLATCVPSAVPQVIFGSDPNPPKGTATKLWSPHQCSLQHC